MLMRTAEPGFLGPGLDSGCEPPDLVSAFPAVELVCAFGVAEPVFPAAGSELVGAPVNAGAWPPTVPALLVSELVWALAGKAYIATRTVTITKLRTCRNEISKRTTCPS